MKKDIERKLLEHLLNGGKASQRNFGDRNGTSRLAVFKRRLVQKGFEIRTTFVKLENTSYGIYHL